MVLLVRSLRGVLHFLMETTKVQVHSVSLEVVVDRHQITFVDEGQRIQIGLIWQSEKVHRVDDY